MPRFQFILAGSDLHSADCSLLEAKHGHVPYEHSAARARVAARPHDLWCRVLGDDEQLLAGVVIMIDRSRKLPWVRLARLEQSVPLLSVLSSAELAGFMEALGRAVTNVVQCTVQLYSASDSVRDRLHAQLLGAGFSKLRQARSYELTLLLPLTCTTDVLANQLSASARRNVRQARHSGFRPRPITDERYGARMAELLRASHTRTGGAVRVTDCTEMIRAAKAQPSTSTVFGTFHPGRTGPAALVGFAQGTVGHETAVYAVAGTERSPELGRVPLSYGLLWELLEWGRERGVPWFDFGGVTAERDLENPLASISQFKRKFGGSEFHIAAEYLFVIDRWQHRLLNLTTRAVTGVLGTSG